MFLSSEWFEGTREMLLRECTKTNTIPGMTAVDGILQFGGGLILYTIPQELATTAVILSAVNLVGGFLATHKILELFRKKDAPLEC